MRRIITNILSICVTTLAVGMAVASANQRAEAVLDRWLLASISVCIVLSVHLLPALLRRRSGWVLWPVWTLCLIMAAYWHSSWFLNASQDSNDVRQAGSAAARAVAAEQLQIEQTLGTIKARPVATVAAQVARTTDEAKRTALSVELAEARRAAVLRDRLVTLSKGAVGSSEGRQGHDEGIWARVGTVDIQTVMSVVAALLVEVLGMLLWCEALAGDRDAEDDAEPRQTLVQNVVNVLAHPMAQPMQSNVIQADDELADLRAAIARGECAPTVRGIRKFVRCSGDNAMRLRRELLTS